ncbi:MAG: hypothetical protein ACKOW9_01110 [Candidatus Paceibacterota bacterium]
MDLPPIIEKTVEDPSAQALSYLQETLKYLGDSSKIHEYGQAVRAITEFEIKVDKKTLENLRYAAEKMGFMNEINAYQSNPKEFERIFRDAQKGVASI